MSSSERKRHTYPKKGDVIGIPLNGDVMAVGVVLAVGRPTVFTAILDFTIPRASSVNLQMVSPQRVHTVVDHGPLGFEERWTIVAKLPKFEQAEWPALKFYQACSDELIVYDPQSARERHREPGEGNPDGWPEDGPSGDVYVEKIMSRHFGIPWNPDINDDGLGD